MPTRRPPSQAGLLLAVGLLFAVVAVLAAITDPSVSKVPVPSVGDEERGVGRPPSELVSPPEHTPAEPSAWSSSGLTLGMFLAGLLLLVLVGVILSMVWGELRDRMSMRPVLRARRDPDEQRRRVAQVKEAVQAGIEELSVTGTDPRSAVIACWLRLEHAAGEAGTPRLASDTPAELVARMLAAHQVSAPVLDRLAAVYRQARYAPAEVGEPMRAEAQQALRQVYAELSRPRTPVPVPAGSEPEPDGEPAGEPAP
ncbi:MAG: DUF4129 domain-containing protein [Micromonosporaceae bacterium]